MRRIKYRISYEHGKEETIKYSWNSSIDAARALIRKGIKELRIPKDSYDYHPNLLNVRKEYNNKTMREEIAGANLLFKGDFGHQILVTVKKV
jgi:hypothetical protein